MKRKLEKYTSKKQGVPLHRLQLLDDGRFDFKTDEIDAIISALREYSSCKKPRNASKANSDSPSTPHPQPMSMGPPMEGMPRPHPAAATSSDQIVAQSTTVATDGSMLDMGRFKIPQYSDVAASNIMAAVPSPEITFDLSPLNSKGVGNFVNGFFSPNAQGSEFSPHLNLHGSTPLFSIAQDPFMRTPFGGNPNDPFLQSPHREPNRKLFASTSTKKNESGSREYNFAEVAVSPILDFRSAKSLAPRRSYFTRESLESPIEGLVRHVAPCPTMQSKICLGVVPLKAAMSITPSSISQRTPVDIAIATPSIAGSAPASLSELITLHHQSSDKPSIPSKRHLFQDTGTAKRNCAV